MPTSVASLVSVLASSIVLPFYSKFVADREKIFAVFRSSFMISLRAFSALSAVVSASICAVLRALDKENILILKDASCPLLSKRSMKL